MKTEQQANAPWAALENKIRPLKIKRLLATTALVGGVGLCVTPALAESDQDGDVEGLIVLAQDDSAAPVDAIPGGGDGASDEDSDRIIVTGSRIRRSGYDAPSPTNVISSDGIQLAGTPNLLEVLNEQPQITNGFFNQNTSFSFGNIGLNQLDLRDLGVRRTLTIVNGRRRAGTPDDSNFLAFDLNNIPTSLVDRVEIITGGTSAVYGADAVAGVINVILKDDFEGLQLEGQVSGNLEEGDYSTYFYNATLGGEFADGRGHAMLHVGRSQNSRLNKRDRGLENDFRFLSNPADTGPGDGIPGRIQFDDVKFAFFGIPTITTTVPLDENGDPTADGSFNTVIWDEGLNRFRFFDSGRGLGTSIDGFASLGSDGGDGRFFDTLIAPIRRTNVYGKARYDIRDNVRGSIEFIYADTNSSDIIGPVFDVFSSFVSVENAFMPQSTRDALIAAGQTGFSLSRQHNEFGPRRGDLDRRFYSIAAGLEGQLFEDRLNWEIVYEYGRTSTENTNRNDRLDANWFNALDSIIDPMTGQAVCRDADARAEGCVPVNIFGEGTISQAAIDYVSTDHTSSTRTSQELFQIVATGRLFDLPAGAVQYAGGFEYRKDSLDFRPSFVWENALGFFASQFSPVDVSNSVTEGFVEVLIPVVKDLPLIENLEIEGAFRLSDYERAGTTESWKAGGSWTVTEDLRIRGTRARAVRAPALGELFDPGSRGASGITDPCDPIFGLDAGTSFRRANCIALGLDPVTFDPDTRRVTTLVFTTGNPDLDVEVGDTFTVGGVITPRWTPGLQIAVDYYGIDLAEGISRIGAQQTADNCVDLETINNQFCGFVTRDGTGNIREIRDSFVNVAGFKIRGIDIQASYPLDLNDVFGGSRADLGQVRFNYVATRNLTNQFIDRDIITGDETSFEGVGLSDLPKWRMVMNALYSRGNYGARWQSRYAAQTQTNVPITDANIDDRGDAVFIPSIWYHDVSAYYNTDFGVRIYGGITNVFDTGPRRHSFTIAGTDTIDDVIGRRFYVGASVNF